MSYRNHIALPLIGQSDHPVSFQPVDVFIDEFDRQDSSPQPYLFIHGELLHDDYGLLDPEFWTPELDPSRNYRTVIDSIHSYLQRVKAQKCLTVDVPRVAWLRYEERRCRSILIKFLRAQVKE